MYCPFCYLFGEEEMSLILGDDGKLLFSLLEPGHWAQEVPGKNSKKLISKFKIERPRTFGSL
jgi:hypothetical protein